MRTIKRLVIGVFALLALLFITYLVILFAFPQTFLAGYRGVMHAQADYSQHTVTVDGYVWHYLDTDPGANNKPLIVMVHGIGGDKDNWTLLAQQLRRQLTTYRLIAMDLPGFGDSVRDQTLAYDIASQTQRLHGFAQALDLPKFHLIGNSMGGHIAGYYATEYSDQVRTLTLINNGGVDMPVKSELRLAFEEGRENPLFVKDVADYDRLMAFLFVTPPHIPEPIKAHFAQIAIDSKAFNDWVFLQIINPAHRLEPRLPSWQKPTLVIWGDTDRVLDKSMVTVMEPLLAQKQVIVLEETGHLPMLERPAVVAEHLAGFLKQAYQDGY